jgi:hypothetical protein
MQRLAIATSVLLTALASPALSQSTRIDLSKLGPQVGERVPEFRLVDQHGSPRTL